MFGGEHSRLKAVNEVNQSKNESFFLQREKDDVAGEVDALGKEAEQEMDDLLASVSRLSLYYCLTMPRQKKIFFEMFSLDFLLFTTRLITCSRSRSCLPSISPRSATERRAHLRRSRRARKTTTRRTRRRRARRATRAGPARAAAMRRRKR